MSTFERISRGWWRLFGNESYLGSRDDDPPGYRLIALLGKCLGKISFNRGTGEGDQDTQYELGLILCNEEPIGSKRGEIRIMVADGVGDAAMKPAIDIRPGEIEFHMPVKGLSGGGGRVSEMWSPDGRYVTVMQGDGNFVTYDTEGPEWTPRWSAWHGRIR